MRGRRALTALALTVSVALTGCSEPTPDPARPQAGTVSVYFVPHADDEQLSMGAAIVADVAAGRDVQLVLLSDNTASRSRGRICEKEGYCLDAAEFGEARDAEFEDSAARLGVPASSVHLVGLEDSHVTPGQAYDALAPYVEKYGDDASYGSMSWLDMHPDHAAIGQALNRLCVDDELPACSFFISPLFQPGALSESMDYEPAVTPEGGWIDERTGTLVAAVAAYDTWDPEHGRYAIGRRYSVPTQFDHLLEFPRSLWHGTSQDFASDARARRSADWLLAHGFGMTAP